MFVLLRISLMEREKEREIERERERDKIYVQRMLRFRNMSACNMVLHHFIRQTFQFLR